MIVELSAENFILFDSFSIELGPGFNVFTGETGSGKSILIGSIQFLLGERSPRNLLKDPQCDLVVQALFDWDDFDDFVPVVRVFTPKGKSKVYVNGRFSTLDTLLNLLRGRVELYSQNTFATLFTKRGYLEFIDGFIPKDVLDLYRASYREVVQLEKELSSIKDMAEGAERRVAELNSFLREFEELSPEPGELERLRRKREVLKRAKEISDTLEGVKALMFDGDGCVVSLLGRVQGGLGKLGELDPAFQHIYSMVSDMLSIASDVERAVSDLLSEDFSVEDLKELEERYYRLKNFMLRYGGSEEEFSSRAEAAKKELLELSELDRKLEEVEIRLGEVKDRARRLAWELSSARRKVAADLEDKINGEMGLLGFGSGRCRFSFSSFSELGPDGTDEVDLLYSPSPDIPFRPFVSVASGGERARMALIFKVLSGGRGAGTIVLDEVDSGVGGRTSLVVGERLRKLGSKCQVLCVTHFPQVASVADRHFLVERRFEGESERATVRPLSFEERISEISRMALGDEGAKEIARKFLEERIQSKESSAR